MIVATDTAGEASTSYGSTTIPQGPHAKTNCLPTITNQDELALSMGSSSSSRRSSDPLSSQPGTPTHPPTFQNLHHFQVGCLLVNITKLVIYNYVIICLQNKRVDSEPYSFLRRDVVLAICQH